MVLPRPGRRRAHSPGPNGPGSPRTQDCSNGYYEEDAPTPVGGCIPHRTGAMLDANFGEHPF
jgi:hypothetical protein